MKTFWVLLSFGLATQLATAQLIRPALDQDPVFHQVLAKRVEYPRYSMRHFPLYGRVYVGFRIDEKGKMTNITLLSPSNAQSGFGPVVMDALKHMPSLNPHYAGEYALPVAFCYINPILSDSLYRPVNKLEEKYLTNRLVLQEWNCTLDFRPAKGTFEEPREVWGYYVKN